MKKIVFVISLVFFMCVNSVAQVLPELTDISINKIIISTNGYKTEYNGDYHSYCSFGINSVEVVLYGESVMTIRNIVLSNRYILEQGFRVWDGQGYYEGEGTYRFRYMATIDWKIQSFVIEGLDSRSYIQVVLNIRL